MKRLSKRSRGKGFTLIELLIVVAIIAILALIAVPNFLEAQTRSKVARAKADMRSMVTALEAYYVDWNSYTFGVGGSTVSPSQWDWDGFKLLTSPVAYITSIPLDPFGLTAISGDRRYNTFELGVGIVGGGAAGRSFTDPKNETGMPSNTFEIESDGPDHNDNTGGTGPAPATSGYPDWGNNPIPIVNSIYDPTNGTVSAGEIFRPGGLRPVRRAAAVLFELAGSN